MVLFVDLDESGGDQENHRPTAHVHNHYVNASQLQKLRLQDGSPEQSTHGENPSQDDAETASLNVNGFSAALSCYPYGLLPTLSIYLLSDF